MIFLLTITPFYCLVLFQCRYQLQIGICFLVAYRIFSAKFKNEIVKIAVSLHCMYCILVVFLASLFLAYVFRYKFICMLLLCRDVFLEKHWKSVIHRSICDYFFEAQSKVGLPFE